MWQWYIMTVVARNCPESSFTEGWYYFYGASWTEHVQMASKRSYCMRYLLCKCPPQPVNQRDDWGQLNHRTDAFSGWRNWAFNFACLKLDNLSRPEWQFCTDLRFLPQMFFYSSRRKISKLTRPIAVKLYHMITIWVHFIIQVHQKIWQKACKIWCDFMHLLSFIANISGTNQHIQNQKDMWSRAIPSHVQRKKSGELWSTN